MSPQREEGTGLGWAGARLGRVVYDEGRIRDRVEILGREITAHYVREGEPASSDGAGGQEKGSGILVLGLLKGSFIFLADLVRSIQIPLQVDFLVASSYGDAIESSGRVDLLYDPGTPIRGRHVVLVEDIVDSGSTLERLVPLLETRGPASLEVCALLHKRRVTLEKEPRWVGFEAPDEFLVGYGLDHAEDFRHLPFIGSL
jgi:hypoxanthine phosphoribosyltransferase